MVKLFASDFADCVCSHNQQLHFVEPSQFTENQSVFLQVFWTTHLSSDLANEFMICVPFSTRY